MGSLSEQETTMTADYPDKSDSLQGGASQVVDIVVIGAGFSGMYALHRLRNDYRLICFEAGESVGGTWYWNRYPGARVDIESMEYSYDFDEALQQEWKWPEMFSAQPELEAYANHVADRFGLRDQIRFSTRVERLEFNESRSLWHVFTDRNDHVICKYVIAATGSLAVPTIPNWPGKDSFQGKLYHTAQWPREGVDVAGKRVGIIGTGSTGIQAAPMLAQTAGHLFVFQRTPAFSMPSGNRPLSEEYERQWKANYAERRERMWHTPSLSLIQPSDKSIFEYSPEEQQEILEKAWSSQSAFQLLVAFKDIMTDRKANDIVAEFVRNKIRATVKDPKVAELLCPTTYAIGAKRLCIDSGYYQMYNRDNVTLVDARTNPITGFTPSGIRTTAATYDLDVIVFATGFDAMTGALTRMDIKGFEGVTMREKWREGPTTYLGMMVSGFPNLFMVHGPGSPSVLAGMIMGGEWQVNWIARVIDEMEKGGFERIDATKEAEESWADELATVAGYTLHKTADSWYTGANVEGKPRSFMVYVGGYPRYSALCTRALDEGYRGFAMRKAPITAAPVRSDDPLVVFR